MDYAHYPQILSMISEGVVVFDDNRKIIFSNQAFQDMTGFSQSEMEHALCSVMQGPETDPATIAAIDAALSSGSDFSGEILNYRKSGETFWNELSFRPVAEDVGGVRHFIGVSRDISARKEAEGKASKFERDFRFIFENVLSGVIVHGPDTEIRYANPMAEQLLGLRAHALVGVPTCDPQWGVLISEDGSPMALSEYPVNRAIAERKAVRGVVTGYWRADEGKMIWLVSNAFPVVDQHGEVTEVLNSFSDITRLIESEAEAHTYRERFELAAKATQDVIFEWNVETGAYWANESFKTVFGFDSPSHISIDTLEDISAVEADHDIVRRATREAIDSGKERFSIKYKFIRSDGSKGYLAVRAFIVRDAKGEAKRIIGTGTDVGILTEAIRALEDSNSRFKIIADTVSDVLWDHDFETGRSWVSPDWPQKLGINPALPSGQSLEWFEYVDISDREAVKRSYHEAVNSTATDWSVEYKMVGTDGRKIDVFVRASILRREDGTAYRMLGNVRDITNNKLQQEGNTRARALEAVGQLTGGVAHDFNNLLMIIQGNAELLEMSELSGEDAASVGLISQAADSAAQLTRRLLSFSGQSRLQTSCVDVEALFEDTVPLLRSGLPESINVIQHIADDIWEPDVDANALEQAIVNLAMNSRDALPKGGDLKIICTNHEVSADKTAHSAGLAPGRYVRISFIDNGEGMSPEVLERVFEPFFTTKDVGKGTGLGLSTVYGFAKQSGGDIHIASEPGRGTTVCLFLPACGSCTPSKVEAEAAKSHKPSKEGKRILVVEDQAEVRAHVVKLLVRLGYVVSSTPDAISAVEMVKSDQTFDLLFTDIIMPGGMNGQELGKVAEEIAPEIKVLYTSGYPASAFEHLGLEQRAEISILHKPYALAQLDAAVAHALADDTGDGARRT